MATRLSPVGVAMSPWSAGWLWKLARRPWWLAPRGPIILDWGIDRRCLSGHLRNRIQVGLEFPSPHGLCQSAVVKVIQRFSVSSASSSTFQMLGEPGGRAKDPSRGTSYSKKSRRHSVLDHDRLTASSAWKLTLVWRLWSLYRRSTGFCDRCLAVPFRSGA